MLLESGGEGLLRLLAHLAVEIGEGELGEGKVGAQRCGESLDAFR